MLCLNENNDKYWINVGIEKKLCLIGFMGNTHFILKRTIQCTLKNSKHINHFMTKKICINGEHCKNFI